MAKDIALFFAMLAVNAAIFLPLNTLATRASRGSKLLQIFLLTATLSIAAGTLAGWWAFADQFSSQSSWALAGAASAITSACCAWTYVAVGPISVDRSVSAHLVMLLYLAPRKRMKAEQLFASYTHSDVLEKRFRECEAAGIVAREGGEVVLTAYGARIASAFLLLGRLLGMRLWFLDRSQAERDARER